MSPTQSCRLTGLKGGKRWSRVCLKQSGGSSDKLVLADVWKFLGSSVEVKRNGSEGVEILLEISLVRHG